MEAITVASGAANTDWLHWSPYYGWLERDAAAWLRSAGLYCMRQWGKAKRGESTDNEQDWFDAEDTIQECKALLTDKRGLEPEERQFSA